MKRDPYKHQQRWDSWKESTVDGIPSISKTNSDIIKQYLSDMEKGLNISARSSKGPRQANRLNSLKDRMIFFSKKFKELYNLDTITEITEDQLFTFFSDMKNGTIKTNKGRQYTSIDTFGKIFKAFWHWHIKVQRKNGQEIRDITEDLDTVQEKPKWVYLTDEELKRLVDNSKFEYRVLFTFLLDTGIRSPTELINVRVSDLWKDCKELNIRQEIAKRKSHGRLIKLMICPDLLKEYIKTKQLKPEDYLFDINHASANKYLKRLAIRVFGEDKSKEESPAGEKYGNITLYDFRHISCCYWLPKYPSEAALKYRFGWKKSDKIYYYSELLGMKDTINEQDLVSSESKTQMQKDMSKLERENEVLKNEISTMKEQMEKILEVTSRLNAKLR